MRWTVEVTSLSGSGTESIDVDADSWQKALELARSARGDAGPLSSFSIEVVEHGCNAVDSATLLRYRVLPTGHEATASPDRAPPPPPWDGPPRSPEAPPANVTSTAQTAPRLNPSSPPRPSPSIDPLSTKRSPTPSTSPPAADRPPAPPPSEPASGPPPAASTEPGAPSSSDLPRSETVARPSSAPARPSSAPPGPDSSIPSQVVFKREQDRTAAVPLTYREYVYLVPSGTSEAAAEAVLRSQLELVRGSVTRFPAGRLVNLAVFDGSSQGRPMGPPLATLTWKDWRGDPVVAFPRRAPAPRSAPPETAVAPTSAATTVGRGPAAASDPPRAQSAKVTIGAPPASAPSAPAPSIAVRTPARASRPPGVRVAGEELIADLFEAMHDLHFVRDAVEASEFCLAITASKLPSQAGLVHLFDIDRREFVVVGTRGSAARGLLLQRNAESDPMLFSAMRKRRAVVLGDAATSEAAGLERYRAVGEPRSLIVAPVMQAGRFLGAIELINPLDGQPFTEADGNAVMYIADQLAEFVAARGVVTDPARIGAARRA